MNTPATPPSPPPQTLQSPRSSSGLAVAALVLGVLGIILSWLLVGGLFALIGLVVAGSALRRPNARRAMAQWGLALSIFGLIGSIGFGVLYRYGLPKLADRFEQGGEGRDFTRWEGVQAPDFELTSLDGKSIKLSDLRGKRVVLDFWATWCPPCREEIPHFIKLHEQTSRDTLVVVGISKEDPGTLKRFVQKHKVPYPIASAAGVALPEPYSLVRYIPTTFFLDRNGIIQRVAVGYHDFDALQSLALAEDFQGQPKRSPASAADAPPSVGSSR